MEQLLSVIVPVYNVEAYLDRCVQSIVSQSYRNLELILIDDGSTDGSSALCDEWARKDSRVVVIHKANGGVSSARNAGLKVAKGIYLTFVDPDDYIAPDTYSLNMDIMLAHEEVDILQYPYCEISSDGHIYKEHRPQSVTLTGAEQIFRNWWSGTPVEYVIWNKIYKRCLWKDVSFRVGHISEDTILVAKFVNCANSFFISEQGIYFYQRDRVDSYTYEYSFDKHIDLFYAHSMIYSCFQQFPDMVNEKVLAFTRLFRRLITAKQASPDSDIAEPLSIVAQGYPSWGDIFASKSNDKLWLSAGKLLGPKLFVKLFLAYLKRSSHF